MKKMRVFLFFLGAFLVAGPSLMAQPGKYGTGPDSTECRIRLSFYREYVRAGDNMSAVPSWRIAMALCPRGASQFLFADGISILKSLMLQPGTSATRRTELIDSVMLMYDIRVEHYPANRISALQNKIREMGAFMPNAKEARLAELEKLLNLMGDATISEMLPVYMSLVVSLYAEEKRSAEDVMDSYTRLIAILDRQDQGNEEVKNNKQMIEDMLISSGVATCENLIALFTPRFEANPNDLELVSKIVALLSSSDCLTSDLFLKSVTALNKLSPSYKTAYSLYQLHSAKGEYQDAVKSLRQAIESPEISAEEKGDYLITEAVLYYKNLNNNSRAMSLARAAMDATPAVRGKAYMLIASIWAQQNCGDNDIERRAKFWVAVDYLQKAKAADPLCVEEADRMIAQFRGYYPLQEEAFMYDLMEGSEYTVTCGGMSEKTTVRTRK